MKQELSATHGMEVAEPEEEPDGYTTVMRGGYSYLVNAAASAELLHADQVVDRPLRAVLFCRDNQQATLIFVEKVRRHENHSFEFHDFWHAWSHVSFQASKILQRTV